MTGIRHIAFALLLGAGLDAWAQGASPPAAPPGTAQGGINALLDSVKTSGDEFLPPDQAFRFDALPEGSDRVRLNWEIAEGYYLYRARIKVTTSSPSAQLGAPEMPAGDIKTDEYFGRQEVYHHELIASVPVARASGGALELPLEVTYQGCADAGLCYPPITKSVAVKLSAGGAASGAGTQDASGGGPAEQDRFAALIRGNPFTMIGMFFLAGLVLAFTPCVLPMVPILSGILIGGGRGITPARGFAVQMPVAIQTRIAGLSNRQSAGTFGGVAIMGALSALIVTTCVAPALVGALLVISQSGEIGRGGAALFAMSLGMGTRLLMVGASAGKLLPQAGPWMDLVKRVFGVMMLAVAAWMLARVLPDRLALSLYAVPALILARLLWSQTHGPAAGAAWGLRIAGLIAGLYGLAAVAGAALGGTNPLAPIPAFAAPAHTLSFRLIKSVADLDREVALASAHGHGVLVDFSADWCTSCKEMERYTFTDPLVHAALATAVLLRADVTANDAQDQALLKRFGIFGPPTIAFYGNDGRERTQYRVVGYLKAASFAARTRAALHAPP